MCDVSVHMCVKVRGQFRGVSFPFPPSLGVLVSFCHTKVIQEGTPVDKSVWDVFLADD